MGSGSSKNADSVVKKDLQGFIDIFRHLVSNTNSVDMQDLLNPNYCNKYTILLGKTIEDVVRIQKEKKLSYLAVSGKTGPLRSYFYRTPGTYSTPLDNCKEIGIFYLQMIFLFYSILLGFSSKAEAYKISSPAVTISSSITRRKTRSQRSRSQRGGDAPALEAAIRQLGGATYEEEGAMAQLLFKNLLQAQPTYEKGKTGVEYVGDAGFIFQDDNKNSFFIFTYDSDTSELNLKCGYRITLRKLKTNNVYSIFVEQCQNKTCSDNDYGSPVYFGNCEFRPSEYLPERKAIFTADSYIVRRLSSQAQPIMNFERFMYFLNNLSFNKDDFTQSKIDEKRKFIDLMTTSHTSDILGSSIHSQESITTMEANPIIARATELNKMIRSENKVSLFEIRRHLLTPDLNFQNNAFWPVLNRTEYDTNHIEIAIKRLCQSVEYFKNPNSAEVNASVRDLFGRFTRLRTSNDEAFKNLGRTPMSRALIQECDSARKQMRLDHMQKLQEINKYVTQNIVEYKNGMINIRDSLLLGENGSKSALEVLSMHVVNVARIILEFYEKLEIMCDKIVQKGRQDLQLRNRSVAMPR